ncbi:murein hydrolase activator EnvC family protein [Ancylomarina longa]|uniref:M23ase beta-sheet core domain-containing protein n=1 Tax=Ancylomarina longa TaxID=2487017 RepID=A0A434AWH1_9BACT|nr:peptidoglycan DD-metalloendopeptidase family protein [Ancylomarina longa]RUT78834.1 hypothetical protein DLK05_06805 [Ancylomarina longa]
MGYKRFISSTFLFVSFLMMMLVSADAVSQVKVSTLKARKLKNQKDIEYTNTLLNKTLKNKRVSIGQLSLLNQRIKKRKELIESIEGEISLINGEIVKNTNEIGKLEKELAGLKKQYEKVILYAYKQKNSYEKLMFLFSSKDFNQAYKRYKYLQQFSEYTKHQGKTIALKKEVLNKKLQKLKQTRKEKVLLLTEKTHENNKIAQEKEQKSALLQQLKKRERQLRKDLKKQKSYDQKLQKEIQRIIRQQVKLASKKKAGSNKFALTPADKILSTSFGQNKGKLPWPTKTGFISDKFGIHPHPILKHVTVRNDGISITTDTHAECRSIFKGEVTHILSMPGLNNVVIIRHGDFFSVYSNLSKVTVKKGDLVSPKQTIGIVYTDEKESQTVLKFQLWKGSTKLNPSLWLVRN